MLGHGRDIFRVGRFLKKKVTITNPLREDTRKIVVTCPAMIEKKILILILILIKRCEQKQKQKKKITRSSRAHWTIQLELIPRESYNPSCYSYYYY